MRTDMHTISEPTLVSSHEELPTGSTARENRIKPFKKSDLDEGYGGKTRYSMSYLDNTESLENRPRQYEPRNTDHKHDL